MAVDHAVDVMLSVNLKGNSTSYTTSMWNYTSISIYKLLNSGNTVQIGFVGERCYKQKVNTVDERSTVCL